MAPEKLTPHGIEATNQAGGTLRDYSRLKLELAGIIRSSKQFAEERKDKGKSNQCHKLLVRLAEDRFNLVVVGQFSRGKSSLMNAILGVERLPTGILPLTSVVTTVSYGDRERVLIHWKWTSRPSEVPLTDLAHYVTQEGNPGNKERVDVAEVQLPVELLRLGFYFIDTPGVGSAIAANTATTAGFLPEADAVIFITSFDSPLAEMELQFLEQVRQHVRKIFLVINKSDLVSSEQRAKVLGFAQERLGELFGEIVPQVFSVSAREGLLAKLSGEQDKLVFSGLPELEAALIEFLRADKTSEFLRRVGDRAADILGRQALDIRISQKLSADRGKVKAFEEQLAKKVADLQSERDSILQQLRIKLCQELPKHFEPELGSMISELRSALVSDTEQVLASPSLWERWLDPEQRGSAEDDFCQKLLSQWLAQHQRRVEQVVQEVARADVQRITDSLVELERIGAEVVGAMPQGANVSPQGEELLEGIPVVFRGVQLGPWRFKIPWWLFFVPLQKAKALSLSRSLRPLTAYLGAFRLEIRTMLGRAGEDWVERLSSKSRELIENAAARHRETIERRVRPGEIVTIEQLREHLEQVLSGLGVLETRDTGPQRLAPGELGGVPSSDLRARCFVCIQMETALFEFMRRRQYELSTSEIHQMEHAEQGGFCALHTWQYEAIASPQGICSAYPPLLFSLARRLHSLAECSSSPVSPDDGVPEILSQPNICAACQLMTAVEQQTARDLLRTCSGENGESRGPVPALCLRHLNSMLLAKPNPELGRLLIQEQARVLERIGEDMQRYSLKREALRWHLASEQENEVYRTGLSRLVGLRSVVAPWKVDER